MNSCIDANSETKMKSPDIPQRFCWTKFGAEAGERVDDILARKERERMANGGVFLWGIGNSVAAGIKALVRLEKEPTVIFSPMRAKAKGHDTHPARVVIWRSARGIDGDFWSIPSGSTVTSRGESSAGSAKRLHYALVCRSDASLLINSHSNLSLDFGSISNLLSGSPLGFSQVTSVVDYRDTSGGSGPLYAVGFSARLVYPYFVELSDPVAVDEAFSVSTQVCGMPDVPRPGRLLF
jgi:hypothetical protein